MRILKRLGPIKTILLTILVVVLVLLGMSFRLISSMSAASMESIDSGGDTRCKLGKCVPFHKPDRKIQQLLGMSSHDYNERVHWNKEPLADIAEEAGVDPQLIIDMLVDNELAWIDEMVADGFYNTDDATEEKDNLVSRISVDVHSPFKDPFFVASEAISVDYGVFINSLHDGLTPADFSEPYDIHPEEIYEAVLRSHLNHIDAQVEFGVISEEDAQPARMQAPKFAHNVVYTKRFYQRIVGRSILLMPIFYATESLGIEPKIEFNRETNLAEQDLEIDLESVVLISARALNIDKDTLQEELNDGKTIAEVSIDNNISPQVAIDELAIAQAKIIDTFFENQTLSELDKETMLFDQNYIIREIVYEVDLGE